MRKPAFLYIDGVEHDGLAILTRQLATANRMGGNSGVLKYQWEVGSVLSEANAVCLIGKNEYSSLEQITCPILTDSRIIQSHNTNIIRVRFPFTAVSLLDALVSTEELVIQLAQEGHSSSIHTLSNQVSSEEIKLGQPETEIVTKDSSNALVASKEQEVKLTSPFMDYYLGNYQQSEQNHLLEWKSDKVWLSRQLKEIRTTCINLATLLTLLSSQEMPKINDYDTPPADTSAFSLESVFWSYGLHMLLTERLIEQFDIANQQFHLKKWPLFGQWETNAKLLMLAIVFTQKFSSVSEAALKSGCDKMFVLNFLVASQLAGLALESRIFDGQDNMISCKHEIAWVNKLREKLNMHDYL